MSKSMENVNLYLHDKNMPTQMKGLACHGLKLKLSYAEKGWSSNSSLNP